MGRGIVKGLKEERKSDARKVLDLKIKKCKGPTHLKHSADVPVISTTFIAGDRFLNLFGCTWHSRRIETTHANGERRENMAYLKSTLHKTTGRESSHACRSLSSGHDCTEAPPPVRWASRGKKSAAALLDGLPLKPAAICLSARLAPRRDFGPSRLHGRLHGLSRVQSRPGPRRPERPANEAA